MSSAYYVRPVRREDIDDVLTLRTLAGPGFTSLMVGDEVLEQRLIDAASAFATPISTPGSERYWLALVHRESGRMVGSAAVKSRIGEAPPFFNFRILTISQASAAAQRRFDMDVLILVNEFTGCSEVGSLFVRAEHRAGGVGRLMAQSRYLLMAAEPQRFSPVVVSELRGVVDDHGQSPFWEALGRHFFKMTFAEADRLSARSDNQFIVDLMPKYPIYMDLLPEPARAVIGRCHPHGEGALKLLQWEGFRFDRVVDVFDGGPLVSCPRDTIRTLREAVPRSLRFGEPGETAAPILLAPMRADRFRVISTLARVEVDYVVVPEFIAESLGAEAGEAVLVWSGGASR